MGAGYQDSTHFQFGNHFNPTTSVYTGGNTYIHIHVHEYISLRCIYIYMYIHVCYIIYMHTCMCRFQHGKCARCTKTACSVSSFWKGDHKHTHIHTYMYALTHNVHVHSLMLLQVMHEFPVVSLDGATATTSRQDYVSHDITSMARQRMDALNTNRVSLSYTYMYMYVCVCMCVCVYTKKKKRMYLLTAPYHSHGIHSWLLSSVVDMTRVVNITRPLVTVHSVVSLSSLHNVFATVMSSSYVAAPPGTQRECPVNPAPQDYRHLESDRALLRPPSGPTQSENMVRCNVQCSCVGVFHILTTVTCTCPMYMYHTMCL